MGLVSSDRNIPVEGVDRIVGPLITIMPSRVAFDATKSIEEMCLQIQQQAVRSYPFDHMGRQHLSKLGEYCASAAKLRNLLVIQPRKDPLPGIFGKLTQGGFNVSLDSYDFVLECNISKAAVDVSANYNPGLLS
ncbi:uncharacterized protein N7529_007296 [Penicillium soppii]|uniref:uncharacterized protein n=1 Tax=Penicillium soppii TaxID=69789 RepID=UPI002547AE8D|nr:uncharacterized protein N7529_007296 [Penicillium soppii]KAJ5865380.1 hypothetical protein N7529_007296 [Penicillium soppii]